jgi:hypothetical protein
LVFSPPEAAGVVTAALVLSDFIVPVAGAETAGLAAGATVAGGATAAGAWAKAGVASASAATAIKGRKKDIEISWVREPVGQSARFRIQKMDCENVRFMWFSRYFRGFMCPIHGGVFKY